MLATVAAFAAVLGCLSLGARTLLADEPLNLGGGDAIGSLPHSYLIPPLSVASGQQPSIVLEAPTLEAIQAVVIDVRGTGFVEVVDAGDGVRVELQGTLTAILDRNLLEPLGVRVSLDVSQGFSGGLGVISQNQHVLRTQILPSAGDLALPLAELTGSGLLDPGSLILNSFSVDKHHHALDMSCSGGTIRLASGY